MRAHIKLLSVYFYALRSSKHTSYITLSGCLFAIIALLLLTKSNIQFLSFAEATVQTSLNPLDDATVKASNASSNYGTATYLSVDNSPIETTYMKFDLTTLEGKYIATAKLKVKVANESSDTQIVKYSENTWDEHTITYNTLQPSINVLIGVAS